MADIMQDYERVTMQLVQEATEYFSKGVFIEQTEANIRKIRVLNQVLAASVGHPSPPRPVEQEPSPVEHPPETRKPPEPTAEETKARRGSTR